MLCTRDRRQSVVRQANGLVVLSFIALWNTTVRAENYFNPVFLSEDLSNVADLSRFEENHRQAPGIYRTDVYLNGNFIATGDVRFIALQQATRQTEAQAKRSGGLIPCMDMNWLEQLGTNLDAFPELKKYKPQQCIALQDAIPDAQTDFNFARLRLDISLPQAALKHDADGFIPYEKWDNGIPALLLNYMFSGDRTRNEQSYYLNLQSGLNLGPWRLRNTGAWSYNQGANQHLSRWRNVSTYLQRAIVSLKSTFIAGDSNSSGDLFDSNGFRGVRLYSVDSMYPYSLQGYAPTVRGIARTHAKVIIRQNGYIVYQSYVPPGPFVINDMNATVSSGNFDVSIEESDGSRQSYTVPYSAVPMLQREGRMKYDIVAGTYRSGSDEKNTPFYLQGTLIAGLRGDFTIYGGMQQSADYHAYMLGGGKNLGILGAVSLDITDAQSKLADGSRYRGQSLRMLYAKTLNHWGTNFQLLGYRYSTQGFYTLNEVTYKRTQGYEIASGERGDDGLPALTTYHNLRYSKQYQLQVNISQSLGDYGSLYFSGNRQTYWHGAGSMLWYQLGYASAWQGINYALSLSWNKSGAAGGSNRVMALNLSMPISLLVGSRSSLANRSYATFNANHDGGGSSWQSGIGGTLLADNNLSYNLAGGDNSAHRGSGSLSANWQSTYGNLSGGYNYARDFSQLNWQLSGGIVGHADGITFSQPLGDTNVLIRAPGAAGVKVENQTGVRTDWRGYTVLPYATVYRYNRIALDTNTLGDHTDIENNVMRVVPVQGALVRASFNTRIGVRALITLRHQGKAVPFGADVKEMNSGIQSMVGADGQAYLSGLPFKGRLEVTWGKSLESRCHADYQLTAESLNKAVSLIALDCG
ncbi:fimbrial protein [Izhakiella australiensis]|uniref:Fimbrial protein n=1 Tax=Izhakiella australiensis TaxID=1926881 RepID=A0A1S8YP34_9GAMM|nr:fimbrial protein [Izhakiella australiensis]